MPIIKGPITLGRNKPIPKEILKEIKLPIKADNWQSTQSKEAIIQPNTGVISSPKISSVVSPVSNNSSPGAIAIPKSKTKPGRNK